MANGFNLLILLVSGALNGLSEVVIKVITKEKYSSQAYLFVYATVGAIISLPLLFFNHQLPHSFLPWVWAGATSGAYVLGNLCLISAYKIEDISNVSIVLRVGIPMSMLLGYLFLSEPLGFHKSFGAFVVLLGAFVIFNEKKRLTSARGLIFSLGAGLFFSIASLVSKFALDSFGPLTFTIFPYIGVAIITFFLPTVTKQAKEIFINNSRQIILAEIFSVLGYITFLIGINRLGLSIGNSIAESLSIITPVLLGIILLKEKSKIQNKVLGSFIIIIGILLIYL